MTIYSVAWRAEVEGSARTHLLQHVRKGLLQEDIALATWFPAVGTHRYTAVIDEVLIPNKEERVLQGNVQMTESYLRRCRKVALSKGAGMAVMHNHLGPGWQDMSADDVIMEKRSVSNPARATGLPALGLTLGTDGTWSARFWLRTGRDYRREWCDSVRIIAPEKFRVHYNPKIFEPCEDIDRTRFRRSIEAWGKASQSKLGKIKVGIVGLGSVGALAAETMGRIGVRHLVLIDMDRVELHNLDRLLHAGPWDIGRLKVNLAAEHLERCARGTLKELVALPVSLRQSKAYRALADCDLILACADKPIARDLMNHLAVCHLIPVIEAGVALRSEHGELHKGHIVSQIVTPDSQCLRCSRQYTTDQLSLELEGLLEEPSYIRSLPTHQRPNTANIFPASMGAAWQQASLFVRVVLGPNWWPSLNHQRFHLSVNSLRSEVNQCDSHCDVHLRSCLGNLGEPTWLLQEEDLDDVE